MVGANPGSEASWLAVYVGQGIVPDGWDQRADAFEEKALAGAMDRLRRRIAETVAAMPDQSALLAQRAAAMPETA